MGERINNCNLTERESLSVKNFFSKIVIISQLKWRLASRIVEAVVVSRDR